MQSSRELVTSLRESAGIFGASIRRAVNELPANIHFPIRKVDSFADVYPWVTLLDGKTQDLAGRHNLPAIHVAKMLESARARDRQATLFGVDYVMKGSHAQVPDEAVGLIERVADSEFTVITPFRTGHFGRIAVRPVSVELPSVMFEDATEQQMLKTAAAIAVSQCVNGIATYNPPITAATN